MYVKLQTALQELSDIQRKAVDWNEGPLLVLAGPGSGKTRVLTCRVARLLEQSEEKRFRVLALTFTNKAAHEMSNRVASLVPGLNERADIHTFHSFCAQVLRQHGAHLGIKPNFIIFSRESDRQAILDDAIGRDSPHLGRLDYRLLPRIDALKARLIDSEQIGNIDSGTNDQLLDASDELMQAYGQYERELRRVNALDFNSLILEVYKLFKYPSMARHYQTVYPYWMVDEFQDTNSAQYALLSRMSANGNFCQIFAVADDVQTIYEWNGASVRRIRTLVEDFKCDVVQLPTNYRCPPAIVEAANRLLVFNERRHESKQPTQSAGTGDNSYDRQIQCRVFRTSEDETWGITNEIAKLENQQRAQTLVLARTRIMLETMRDALLEKDVPASILMRRDDFSSPQLRWLVACLGQLNRPLDLRNLTTLVETFSNFTNELTDLEELLAISQTTGLACLTVWLNEVQRRTLPSPADQLVNLIETLAVDNSKLLPTIDRVIKILKKNYKSEDLNDDLSAWKRLSGEIRSGVGRQVSLDRFLQELELRSKEPIPSPGAVSLATIHGAKGLEFDNVYLVGLAEEILPSWHSIKKGNNSAALEEERRGCFVAITRTKKRLILSRARQYNKWQKEPSRFLAEMGLCGDSSLDTRLGSK